MKPISSLIAITGIVSAFYLGHLLDHFTRSFERRFDSALSESSGWRAEADGVNQRLDQLPARPRGVSQQAVKGGAQQLDKEIVGAPTEMAKTIVKNTESTAEKVYKSGVRRLFGK